jgi:2-haloacid dehalogenase
MIHACFDLYGTLLDTSSIVTVLEEQYDNKAPGIAGQWRRYQLEYTWRLNSLGKTFTNPRSLWLTLT